jgi:hypothetical protein
MNVGVAQQDPWPRTLHWCVDHSSHGLTERQVAHLAQINRPTIKHVCLNCGWPASIGDHCMVCCVMYEAVVGRKGLMRAHLEWRRKQIERELGLL